MSQLTKAVESKFIILSALSSCLKLTVLCGSYLFDSLKPLLFSAFEQPVLASFFHRKFCIPCTFWFIRTLCSSFSLPFLIFPYIFSLRFFLFCFLFSFPNFLSIVALKKNWYRWCWTNSFTVSLLNRCLALYTVLFCSKLLFSLVNKILFLDYLNFSLPCFLSCSYSLA